MENNPKIKLSNKDLLDRLVSFNHDANSHCRAASGSHQPEWDAMIKPLARFMRDRDIGGLSVVREGSKCSYVLTSEEDENTKDVDASRLPEP